MEQLYLAIKTCNALIDRVPEVEGLSDEIRKQRVAEAKLTKAHHYFILVQLFGPLDSQLIDSFSFDRGDAPICSRYLCRYQK
ncbi:RagB/SusD family nutrient uptake outer membrane protein [Cyclobacterium sp.]|uniref:RagB/SusD family nutrient uptake outer membrane protein n=1 Tax=Cyclobacterium sp. TaxID=1966343 RepID=UPI0019859425|nr:RagB/SusD family nutrient uptake outer membrane protein [Cyclobacterium sp.]MBD3626921.1 RagB/SusD family nutrient uptake outer membrane protein [Cyclobacterium sp.]